MRRIHCSDSFPQAIPVTGPGRFAVLILPILALLFQPGLAAPGQSIPAVATPEWQARIQADLASRQYHITEDDAPAGEWGYGAVNPGQQLRVRFGAEGIEMGPLSPDAKQWSWGLTLRGIKTDQQWIPTGPAPPHIDTNRIEYRRDVITEWYINNAGGLEQGFTLSAPPRPGLQELSLVLEMDGDTRTDLVPGEGLRISHPETGEILRFGKLFAFDAKGRNLPAEFGIESRRLIIRVATAEAVYPITIDPLATTPGNT